MAVLASQCKAFSPMARLPSLVTTTTTSSSMSSSVSRSPLHHSSLLTQLAMSDGAAPQEAPVEAPKETAREKKSPSQKAKNGILLVPLVLKFCIVMAIKLLTDVIVLPILIIIRSPVWFPKRMKQLFGKKEGKDEEGESPDSEPKPEASS